MVVRTEIDYRRAAKLGDRLVVEGWLDQLQRARFWCAFRIIRPADETVIANCRQMMALIEMPAAKLLPLPTAWEKYRPEPTHHNNDRRRSDVYDRRRAARAAGIAPAAAASCSLCLPDCSRRAGPSGDDRLERSLQSHRRPVCRRCARNDGIASAPWPTNDGLPRLPKPPLLYWLIIASFKIFGVNAAAARLPIALAMIASVTLTFLIAERLADYWRGFFAGLIYLCFCGTALLGRILMPEPLFSAFIAGAVFCGISGYQRRRGRAWWFLGFWICCALACLTKSLLGLIYPLAIFLLLSCFIAKHECASLASFTGATF